MRSKGLMISTWFLVVFFILSSLLYLLSSGGDYSQVYTPENPFPRLSNSIGMDYENSLKYDNWKRNRERFCSYRELTKNGLYMKVFEKRKTSSVVRLIDCAKSMKKKRVLIYTHVNVPKRIDEAMETWMVDHEENKASGLYEYLNIEIDIIGWGSEKNHDIVEKICPFSTTEMVEKLGCILRYLEDEKSDYDFYLRLDDDTYLFITEFAYLLSTFHLIDESQPMVMGYVWKGFHLFGGASIFFNRPTLPLWNSVMLNPPKCELCIWDDYLMGYILHLEGKSTETFYEYLGIWWGHPMQWFVESNHQGIKFVDLVDDYHNQFPEPLAFHYSAEPERMSHCTHRRYHGSHPIDREIVVIENLYSDYEEGRQFLKWKENCLNASKELEIPLRFIRYDYSTIFDLLKRKNVKSDPFLFGFDEYISRLERTEEEHAKILEYIMYIGGWVLHFNPEDSFDCRERLEGMLERTNRFEDVVGSELIFELVDEEDLSSRISFIGGSSCNLSVLWLLSEIIMNIKLGKMNVPFATAVLDQKKPLQFQKRVRSVKRVNF